MARIAGVDLPRDKRVEIGLTYIYGIGRKSADAILAKTGVSPDTRCRDLTDDEVRKLAEQSSKQTAEITASVQEIQRVTQIALESMESAGAYVASTDVAMQAARSGLDIVAQHGQQVASISRRIADGTREQAATGNEIAHQIEGIVGGIDRTSTAISGVTEKTAQMKAASSQLRQLIAYFRFIR